MGDVLVAAIAVCGLISGIYGVLVVLSLRARIEMLEVERPKFLAEMNGLLDACDETLERAEAKRKRADNATRAIERQQAAEAAQPTLPRVMPKRGTVLEKLG